MDEADELVEELQAIVGRWPGRGAVVESVTKCAGDDLSSLVVEVEFRDATTGVKHSMRFGDVVRFAGWPDERSELAGQLAGMILGDLDEFLFAID